MASAASVADAHLGALARNQGEVRTVEPSEIAWIAVIPCALATVLLVLLLGPPIGDLLLRPDPARETLWPYLGARPETTQHGRMLAALLGPALLAATVLACGHPRLRARLRLRDATIRVASLAGQLAVILFVVACFAIQYELVWSADFILSPHRGYFTPPTLVFAAVAPLVALALLRDARVERTLRGLARETRARRIGCLVAAVVYIARWLLTAVNVDSSIGNTIEAVSGHLLWTMGETFAVLNGRTPLVDFHAQYGQVWAYVAAVPMTLFGTTIATYTLTMVAGSGLALLAAYATLRRVARSSLLGLALFAPFLATAAFMVVGPPDDRYGSQNLYILWPIRYAGPFVLAWLVARHVDGASPRRPWAIFAFVGLVAVNSMDFGLAAGTAALVALALVATPRSRRALVRLGLEAAAGALATVALFSLLTLLRSGSLPHFGLLFEFGRLYGIAGWAQLPTPVLGVHVALFLTFAIALVVACVRVTRDDPDRLMTALLAWIGVFGLATSVYYAARAHPMTLFHFFGPWAFAIALLTVVAVRDLSARGWRRPTLPQLATLFAFGLTICSLAQTPPPGPQIARLRDATDVPTFEQRPGVAFVKATTRPHEPVVILTPLSHRIAYDAGVVNVAPYTSVEAMPSTQQLDRTIAALRDADGDKLYLSMLASVTRQEQIDALLTAGFVVKRYSPERDYVELVDRGG